MNIEQSKTIPLSVILSKMDRLPQRENDHEIWFFSPLREETKASFKINKKNNTWIDFGTNQSGDVIDLVRFYLESQGVSCTCRDALRWTRNMTDYDRIKPVRDDDDYHRWGQKDHTLVLRKAIPIEDMGLIRYGESRGIPPIVLKKYLLQVHFLNNKSGNTIKALGIKNESKGYELRNPIFKGCLQKKDITFVRGKPKPPNVHVFEGFMDFLSVITQREGKPFDDDAIILNSLNCLDQGSAFIKNYGYERCFTWMDNDVPGKAATQSWEDFCKNEEGLRHIPMNAKYEPFKDVNAHHMAKLEL